MTRTKESKEPRRDRKKPSTSSQGPHATPRGARVAKASVSRDQQGGNAPSWPGHPRHTSPSFLRLRGLEGQNLAESTRSMRPLSASGSVSSQISDEPRRLLDAKVAKKRADQDYNLMLNRVKRLRLETERSRKNMQETRTRAEEIVRLKAQNELKARAREHDRQLRESLLDRQRQQRTLMSAQRQAATRSAVERIASEKRNNVQQCRQERQLLAQQAWEARKGQEERAARIKHEIYTRERQAVHLKYRQRHMQQLRAVQQYEEKVAREEQERLRREKVLTQCIRVCLCVCLCSHLLVVGNCVGREFVSRADSAFLVVMGVTRACTCRRSSS